MELNVTIHQATANACVVSLSRCGRRSERRRTLRCLFNIGAAFWAIAFVTICRADPPTGQQLFERHCVVCHGAHGEGTKDHFPRPIGLDRTVGQLAQFISKSMPPDTPGTCSGDDADRVAAFIVATFYTRETSSSHQPKVETARLTGRQYTNAIADLMVAFFGSPERTNDRGLRGNYATIDANGDGKQAFSRVDAQVQFDFGVSSPKLPEIDPAEFAISWTGSIHAPATGDYEFILRSPNSVSLFINDRKNPLIDAWVKSGDQVEYRSTIRLLAGRSYRLQLNFTKAGQGGKKPEQLRARIAPAAISLSWKPPGRGEELVPSRHLSPVEIRETLIVQTAFPPDDRSTGFERGTSVSAEWGQATTDAAVEAAMYVRDRVGDYCGIAEPDRQHSSALREFCGRFAARAFRRPLTPEQHALYVDRQFAKAPDPLSALERVVLMVLTSPRFLFVELAGVDDDQFTTASRLSFTLWDSLPDDALLAAAAAGQLQSREQVANQALRMTSDPRFDGKLREFLLQWLKIDQIRDLKKDATQFPEFQTIIAADLRTSLELFLEDVLRDERADIRQLLLADYLFLNDRLASIYGGGTADTAAFRKVVVDSGERAGILTHPYLMAAFADSACSSPIRRGVFLARSVLGRTLQPPPDAVTPVSPALHSDLTTRERTALQTSAQSCQSCHGLINPLGFTLERFDALGRFRTEEKQRPIDATGSYLSRSGDRVKFKGARDLAAFLVDSDEFRTALIEKLFYYFVKQPIRAFGSETLPTLRRDFVKNVFNLRLLMADIATAAAFPPASHAAPQVHPNGN